MREDFHDWMLEGAAGPTLYTITNRQLIEMGYLAEATVTMYQMPKFKGVPDTWPECYEFGVVLSRYRNEKIIKSMLNEDGPILCLVQSVEHGYTLEKLATKAGLETLFISGKDKVQTRQGAIKWLREGKLKVVIGSTIWDQGVDIPEIATLILAGGGKSQIKQLQRVGRSLRLAEGKDHAKVIDFYDYTSRHLQQHSQQRKLIWLQQGFKVNLVEHV